MGAEQSSAEQTEEFVTLLTSAQDSLYRYVLSLVAGQHDRAKDLLQETNLVIWRKASEFKRGTDFRAWSRRIAHFCVLSEVRDAKRHPIMFSDELLSTLAAEYDAHVQDAADRRSRLEECLSKLPSAQKATIRLRYVSGLSISDIASREHKSVNAVSAFLYRVRLALLDCVARKAV